MEPRDLLLQYKFTDRGGLEVFDIVERSHEVEIHGGQPKVARVIGQARIDRENDVFEVEWAHERD